MKCSRKNLILILVSSVVLTVPISREVRADEEGMVMLTKIEAASTGLDNSGPVHVEASQSAHGLTQLTVSAFGKLQSLSLAQLSSLAGQTFNSIGLSYSRGYPETGGRSVYVLLCQGFSSGIRVFEVVTVTESGCVRVNEARPAGS